MKRWIPELYNHYWKVKFAEDAGKPKNIRTGPGGIFYFIFYLEQQHV